MQVAPPSSVPGNTMHKNRLQEYAQKSGIPLPLYQTKNEGYPHAPQFRSTVNIDGETFRSYRTFGNRKEAEQDVAKLALEGISSKIKQEGAPLKHEDITFCKSILHEYTVKMNLGKPTYITTSIPGGKLPVFKSSLVCDGTTYTGAPGRNKKEAEQMAARTFIESVLANSNTSTFMSQIIKSKGKLYSTFHKGSSSDLSQNTNLAFIRQIENSFSNSKGKEVLANLTNDKFPGIAYSEAGKLVNAAETLSFPPETKKPKEEYICEPSSEIVNDMSYESYLVQCNQSNDGIPLVGPSMQHLDSPDADFDSGGKRSNNYQGSYQSKKTRTVGGLPPTPPVNS